MIQYYKIDIDVTLGSDGSDLSSYSNSTYGIVNGHIIWISSNESSLPDSSLKKSMLLKNGLGTISRTMQLEDGGDLETNSGVSIAIVNDDNLLDRLAALDISLLGRKIVVTIVFGATSVNVFLGVVDKVETSDISITLSCIPDSLFIDSELLTKSFSEERYPSAPSGTKGKPVPRVLGQVNTAKFFPITGEGSAINVQVVDPAVAKPSDTITFTDPLHSYTIETTTGGSSLYLVTNRSDVANGDWTGYLLRVKAGSVNSGDTFQILGNNASAVSGSYYSVRVSIDGQLDAYVDLDVNADFGLDGTDEYQFEILEGIIDSVPSEREIQQYYLGSGPNGTVFAYSKETDIFTDVSKSAFASSVNTTIKGHPYVSVNSSQAGNSVNIPTPTQFVDCIRQEGWTTITAGAPTVTDGIPGIGMSCSELFDRDPDNGYTSVFPAYASVWYAVTAFRMSIPSSVKWEDVDKLSLGISFSLDAPASGDRKMSIVGEAYDLFGNKLSNSATVTTIEFTNLTSTKADIVIPSYWAENSGASSSDYYQIVNRTIPSPSKIGPAYNLLEFDPDVLDSIKTKAVAYIRLYIYVYSNNAVSPTNFVLHELCLQPSISSRENNNQYYGPVWGEKYSGTGAVTNTDVASLLLSDAGLQGSEFSFSSVTATSKYKVGKQFENSEELSKTISQLAYQTFIAIRQNPQSGYKVQGVDFLQDGIDQQGTAPIYDNSKIIEGSISAELTDPSKVYGRYKINYNYNYARSKYDDFISIANTDSSYFPPVDVYDSAEQYSATLSYVDNGATSTAIFTVTSPNILPSIQAFYSPFMPLSTGQLQHVQASAILSLGAGVWKVEFTIGGGYSGADPSAELYIDNNSTPTWKRFVAGVSNYTEALALWSRAQDGYLYSLSQKELVIDCPWFNREGYWFTATDNPAMKFISQLTKWASVPKKRIEFDTYLDATSSALNNGDIIRVKDLVATDDNTLVGVIENKTISYTSSRLTLSVLIFPDALLTDTVAFVDEQLYTPSEDHIDEELYDSITLVDEGLA